MPQRILMPILALTLMQTLGYVEAAHAVESAESSSTPTYQDQDVTELLNKISVLREALKASAAATTSGGCKKLSDSTTCSFESYCDKLAGKGQDFYLYQDSEGHQVPNYPLISVMSTAESCMPQAFPEAAVRDPFNYPEQLMNEKNAGGKENLRQNLENYEKQLSRTKNIFQDAKKRIIQVLEKRRTSKNSKQIANMISRVGAVELSPAQLGDGVYVRTAAGCEVPNAFYQPQTHKVTVCPQILNLPEAALFEVIAHELGHAIDPCALTLSVSKTSDGGYSQEEPEFFGGEISKTEKAFQPIPLDQLPLNKVISCLQQNDSIGAKVPSKKELLDQIDKDLLDEESADLEARRERVNGFYDKFKYCGDLTGHNHLQEAFSDWMATQALTQKLSDISDSTKAKEYALGAQFLFMASECSNIQQASLRKVQSIEKDLAPRCSEFDKVSQKLNQRLSQGLKSDHPMVAARVNRIILAKPEIQRTLGCTADSKINGKECKE